MIGGVDLSRLRDGAGPLSPLVVTPAQADITLRRGLTPDGQPAVYVVVVPKGWPVQLVTPIPWPAWEQLTVQLERDSPGG